MRKWFWVVGSIVLLVLFIVSFVGGYWLKWDWTGFPAKTLWDWLNLLGVLAIPIVAGFGVAWYTTKQTQASEAANEQQRKTELEIAEKRHKAGQEAAEKRHQTELAITTDNQREAALQAYMDKMWELLLVNDLQTSPVDDKVRKIARVRTLTVLRMLDPSRKASVLRFLYEAGLIDKDKSIVDLDGANLAHTNLSGNKLNNANLEGAYMSEADLSFADLTGTNLMKTYLWGAKMYGTNLSNTCLMGTILCATKLEGANLSDANLDGAFLRYITDVTDEQLSKAKSLKGAIMPDESKHP